jgi:hypothetical protein
LWEWYKKDYKPKYVTQRSEELSDIISSLENLDGTLQKHIIYFDDPVGKTKYEPNEKFERYIAAIIPTAKFQDVFIVITMRSDVYKDFKPSDKESLKDHISVLDIGQPSYDQTRRTQMLLKWSSVMKCKWLHDPDLSYSVLKAIENGAVLPTPLNIKEFAFATNEKVEVKSKERLFDILYAKSKDIAISYSKQVSDMDTNSKIFLSFIFLSDDFLLEFIKDKYERIVKREKETFERIFNQFLADNTIKQFTRYDGKDTVQFSHPSYWQVS